MVDLVSYGSILDVVIVACVVVMHAIRLSVCVDIVVGCRVAYVVSIYCYFCIIFFGGGWPVPNRFFWLEFRFGVLARVGTGSGQWYIVRRMLCDLIIVFYYIFYFYI